MADLFELTLALDLRDELSVGEVAELHWHLGSGPMPEKLRIVTDFPVVTEDEQGGFIIENRPEPLLGQQGAAYKVGGVLVSVLLRRQDTKTDVWALTSRQEIHPDDFERTGELLGWLAARAGERHKGPDGSVVLGWIRFHEECRPHPLIVSDGTVVWPSTTPHGSLPF
ncbi:MULTISPECIES: hypothetical protein [Streptomyces]|uniref:hypothetical protein n=1 Tax=Streptomyces TaxID=1883 RepID=UPI0016799777|nr:MULTISPECIES: hypothetical protein [Streptomyces]MBK3522878.1 hypothetical protein [Streptomyces sp. MBT70]GGS12006.1 hypothetical protein GCM10010236_78200 [Streptomyces eurythermus]